YPSAYANEALAASHWQPHIGSLTLAASLLGLLGSCSGPADTDAGTEQAALTERAEPGESAELPGCRPAPPPALEASLQSGQIRVGSAAGSEKADELAPTAMITAWYVHDGVAGKQVLKSDAFTQREAHVSFSVDRVLGESASRAQIRFELTDNTGAERWSDDLWLERVGAEWKVAVPRDDATVELTPA